MHDELFCHERLAPFSDFLRQRNVTRCGRRQHAVELSRRLLHCGVHARLHAESGTYATVMSLSDSGFQLLSSSSPAPSSRVALSRPQPSTTDNATPAAELEVEVGCGDSGHACCCSFTAPGATHARPSSETTSCSSGTQSHLHLPWSCITSVSLESYTAADAPLPPPATTHDFSPTQTHSSHVHRVLTKGDSGANADAAEMSVQATTMSSYVCVETLFGDVLLLKPTRLTAEAEACLLHERTSGNRVETTEVFTSLLSPTFWVDTILSRIPVPHRYPSSLSPLSHYAEHQCPTHEEGFAVPVEECTPTPFGGSHVREVPQEPKVERLPSRNSLVEAGSAGPSPPHDDAIHMDRVAATVTHLQRLLHDKQRRIQLLSQEVHRMRRGGTSAYATVDLVAAAAAATTHPRSDWNRYGGVPHVHWAANGASSGEVGDERFSQSPLDAVVARRVSRPGGLFRQGPDGNSHEVDNGGAFDASAIDPNEFCARPWTAGGFLAPPSAQLADAALAALPEHPRYSSSSSSSCSSSLSMESARLPPSAASATPDRFRSGNNSRSGVSAPRHVDAAAILLVETDGADDDVTVSPEAGVPTSTGTDCVVQPPFDTTPPQRVQTSPATTRVTAIPSSRSAPSSLPSGSLPPAAPLVWEGTRATSSSTSATLSGRAAHAQSRGVPPGVKSPPRTSSAPTNRRKPQHEPLQHHPQGQHRHRDRQPPTRGAVRSRGDAQQEPQPGSANGHPRGLPSGGGIWQRPAAPRPAARGAAPEVDAARAADSRQLGLGWLEPRATREDLRDQPELLRLYNDIHGSQSGDSSEDDRGDDGGDEGSNPRDAIVLQVDVELDEEGEEEFDDAMRSTH